MSRGNTSEPVFPRGSYQIQYAGQTDASMPFAGVLGREWWFEDLLWDQGANGPPPVRSGAMCRCRLVRNDSGFPITPKQLCRFDPLNVGSVIGTTTIVDQNYAPADEFLPAAGVPDNGVFWVVTLGNAKVVTAATLTADIAAGDYLVPSAATAGAIDIFPYASLPTTAVLYKSGIQASRNARARATAARLAAGGGGLTITICMTE